MQHGDASPKAASKRRAVWGVSEISGTNTIARPPSRDDALDGLDVDVGFAAPGNAVDQRLVETASVQRRVDVGERDGLLGRGAGGAGAPAVHVVARGGAAGNFVLAQRAGFDRARDDRAGKTGQQRIRARYAAGCARTNATSASAFFPLTAASVAA